MKASKALLCAFAGALALTTILMVTVSAGSVDTRVREPDRALPMHDAPYRDGLFQGRLAALRGAANRPSVGRWSSDAAREHFVLGYEEAYWDAQSRPH
jgi:hypothetical protein